MRRGEVARVLNRSIASVRRMEGNELHPWRDERGHHHFDEDEVNEVAAHLSELGHRETSVDSGTPAFILELQLQSAEQRALQAETESIRLKARVMQLEGKLRRLKRKGAAYEEELSELVSKALDLAAEGGSASTLAFKAKLHMAGRRWCCSPYDP